MSDVKPPKIIHELTEEDLIALASGASKEEIIKKITPAAQFILDLNVKHGHEKVSAMLVYYTYKHHKGFGARAQPKVAFLRDFNKYFTPVRDKDGIHYLLDPKPFDLTEETYWAMRAEWRKQKQNSK